MSNCSLHRVLVVGTGSIGTRHVRCMLRTRRAEVGICEPRPAPRLDVQSSCPIVGAYASLDDALAQRWDAAVIAVPAPLHVPIAQRLAELGIGLLIEKPLGVTEAGVAALAEVVDQRALPCAVAYVYRAHPAVRAMREAMRSGRFGKPLQVVAVSGQPFAHFRPAYRDIYYAHHDQGGGAIQDGLTHTLNLCEWLVGPITRLSADAAHLRLEGVDVEDTAHVIARHDDHVMATYAVNHHQAPNESSITIVCEAGTLRLEIKQNRWLWMAQPCGPWHEEPAKIAEYDDWFTCQERAFLDYLEGTAPPLCSLQEGWQTLRVNRAALASVRDDGAWQTVSPLEPAGV